MGLLGGGSSSGGGELDLDVVGYDCGLNTDKEILRC